MLVYPKLKTEIILRGLTQKQIAKTLGLKERTFSSKMHGNTAFTWPEVQKMRDFFFPDLSLEELLSNNQKIA